MSGEDIILLAAYAAYHNLTPSASRAATTLRSANNAALKARYGDSPMPLPRGAAKLAEDWKKEIPEALPPRQAINLTNTFLYQCAEGDVLETHKGAALLRKIQKHAADAMHQGEMK